MALATADCAICARFVDPRCAPECSYCGAVTCSDCMYADGDGNDICESCWEGGAS